MMNVRLMLIILWMALAVSGAIGQDEEKKPWTNKAELSLVGTFGNSESQTLGFGNDFSYKKGISEFTAKVSAIRAESTSVTRTAVGSEGDYMVLEESVTEKKAEKYAANLKYKRMMGERLFWFAGLDWDRNEFSGISNRTGISAGLGHVWVDREDRKFKTDYGFQYITESPVVEPEGFDDAYMAGRVDYDLMVKTSENSVFEQNLRTTINLDDSDDYRGTLDNSLAVNISDNLALKVGLQLIYDNQPGYAEIPLMLDLEPLGTVLYQLDELDTVFTTSLVINF